MTPVTYRVRSRSVEHRDSRLDNMRVHAQEERAAESEEQRSLRLEDVREHTRITRASSTEICTNSVDQPSTPFYTPSALKSIRTFHAKMTTCAFSECGTCNESFPSMNASQRTECIAHAVVGTRRSQNSTPLTMGWILDWYLRSCRVSHRWRRC